VLADATKDGRNNMRGGPMYKPAYSIVVLLLLLFAGTTAYGQSQATSKVTIDVPFSFFAGGQLLPAGQYDIIEKSMDNPDVIVLLGPGASRTFVLTKVIELSSPSEEAKVVFKTNGNQMVLHQVKMIDVSHMHDVFHETGIEEP
jgi:hypothetical protein